MKSRRAGDPPELVACNNRLLETLPWIPKYAKLDTIVAHALQWERELRKLAEGDAGNSQRTG
jgi:UDP-glucose 4-epimerase